MPTPTAVIAMTNGKCVNNQIENNEKPIMNLFTKGLADSDSEDLIALNTRAYSITY
jgi:hypothetical protein